VSRYRFALTTVVTKEAKAYGFAVVVWSTGTFLMVERGRPTPGAILVFGGAIMLAQAIALMIAYGTPTATWVSPQDREYVLTAFHGVPIVAAVLIAWALAAGVSGMWAFFLAPLCAALAYQLLLGLESMLLSASDSESSSD
jgi:hypothetical protein